MKLAAFMSMALLLAWPATAAANSTATGNATISATVPLVCAVDSFSVVIDPTHGQAAGIVQEMCNGSNGFRMMATYRSLDSGEFVRINYDGQVSQLGVSGLTQIAYRSGASFKSVPIVIDSHDLTSSVAISIGITAS